MNQTCFTWALCDLRIYVNLLIRLRVKVSNRDKLLEICKNKTNSKAHPWCLLPTVYNQSWSFKH